MARRAPLAGRRRARRGRAGARSRWPRRRGSRSSTAPRSPRRSVRSRWATRPSSCSAADILGRAVARREPRHARRVRPADPRRQAPPRPDAQRRDRHASWSADSALRRSHADCGQVQDAYALRCIPQVHGAARAALRYVAACGRHRAQQHDRQSAGAARRRRRLRGAVGRQLPRRFDRAADRSHGRRADRPSRPSASAAPIASWASTPRAGCRPFLAVSPGLDSGFMLAQVTAAALASECKTLAVPAARRHDPDLGRQGGPRQHGADRRAQARGGGRRARARPRDRGDRRPRGRSISAPIPPACGCRPCTRRSAVTSRRWSPIAATPPRSRRSRPRSSAASCARPPGSSTSSPQRSARCRHSSTRPIRTPWSRTYSRASSSRSAVNSRCGAVEPSTT